MLLTSAREIAEAELRRINAEGGPNLEIGSSFSVPLGWVFLTVSRGLQGECSADKVGIAVREDGCVFHGLGRGLGPYAAGELEWLIPQGKGDFDRARAAIAVGYPAVEPIFPALLKCLQDMNWPIAFVVGRFLSRVGAPLPPHLRAILAGNDEIWKYWIVGDVIGSNAELFAMFHDDLNRLANNPTTHERAEEVDQQAREVLANGPHPWPDQNPRSVTGEW